MSDTAMVPAKWTNDCQGKMDYDGTLVKLSTRYWPRGGGFSILTPGGEWLDNGTRPQIRPSARAKIFLGDTADEYYETVRVVSEQYFEADTQEEVRQAVEEWAAEQFRRIKKALHREFIFS